MTREKSRFADRPTADHTFIRLSQDPKDWIYDWTPLETFRARDRGGWDVTIPATAFRGIDDDIVERTIDFLNMISVLPFFDEDCTTMVERAFGKRGSSLTAQLLVL